MFFAAMTFASSRNSAYGAIPQFIVILEWGKTLRLILNDVS